MVCLRAFPDEGIVALYEEPSTSGAIDDIDAARNAPAKDPDSYFDMVYFHSTFDYMEVHAAGSVSISHSTIAAVSAPPGVNPSSVYDWASAVDDKLVYTHSLGYLPFAIVATTDMIIAPSTKVQSDTGGRTRYVTPYVTTTELRLWESASKTASTLGSTSITYQYIVFKEPAGDENDILWEFDPDTGIWQMGRGRFRTNRRYLQTAPGGSPLVLNVGRNVDLKNGAPRFILADGTIYAPIGAGTTWILANAASTPATSLAYSGTFTNDDGIEVQAP